MSMFKWHKPVGDDQAEPTNPELTADNPSDTPSEGSIDRPEDGIGQNLAESSIEAAVQQTDFFETPLPTESFGEMDSLHTQSLPELPASQVMPDPGQRAVDEFFGPPRLDRPRLDRAPLIPAWVWKAAASVLGVVVLLAVGIALANGPGNISVPRLAGVNADVAKTRLAEQGLGIRIVEHRYSTSDIDMVLGQTPDAGTKLKRGDVVSVVVSAGTEQFSMPGVVGDGLLLAQSRLEQRGLEVRIEPQPSQQPSGTVIASNPPAGYAVHTGDIVRLTVAATGEDTTLLLPFDMTGVRVVIDPAPVNDAMTDVPLDVARRLRSLIEASHGVVVTTRALAETSTLDPVAARVQRAATATATVAVGFSVAPKGAGGLVVYAPSPVLAFASSSVKLSSRITSDLAAESGTVLSATSTTDTVLTAAHSPWARVQLGAATQREDMAKFSDGAWEDSVARALYRAIAVTYGKRTGP
jgi:hypothetical protein